MICIGYCRHFAQGVTQRYQLFVCLSPVRASRRSRRLILAPPRYLLDDENHAPKIRVMHFRHLLRIIAYRTGSIHRHDGECDEGTRTLSIFDNRPLKNHHRNAFASSRS